MPFFWIILYGLTDIISSQLSCILESARWIHSLSMFLFAISFIVWIFKSRSIVKLGFQFPQSHSFRKYGDVFILLILPIVNFLTGKSLSTTPSDWLLLFSVSLVEELLFRGFLFAKLCKTGLVSGIIWSSILFALIHGVNFFQSRSIYYVMMQILCAFSVSICYCCSAIRHKTLIICIIAHFLTNITASGIPNTARAHLGLYFSILVYLVYGFQRCYKLNQIIRR